MSKTIFLLFNGLDGTIAGYTKNLKIAEEWKSESIHHVFEEIREYKREELVPYCECGKKATKGLSNNDNLTWLCKTCYSKKAP